jgi:uncharacterized membrane protein YhdT
MDTTTLIIIVLVALLIVAFLAYNAKGCGGFKFNAGTLQSILLLLILVFLVIWLGEKVLG